MSESLALSISPPNRGGQQAASETTCADDIDPRDYYFFKPAYTVREAVEATGLSRTTLYKASKAGRLVAFSNGRTRLFLGRDLAAFMLKMYRATRTKPIDEDGPAKEAAAVGAE